MAEHHLKSPLSDEDISKLRLGDTVYISGECFTCRSRLQKYIFDEKNILPFNTKDRNILIHNGPIVVKENEKWRLVSFMPTSSIRFEKWGAKSVDEWNLKMIVGKTTMGEKTAQMMKKKKCVHVSPRSVSPNLWIDSIEVEDVHLFNELGSIEAAWLFKVNELGPFIVDIDSEGNNYFDKLDDSIAKTKSEPLKSLGSKKASNSRSFTNLYLK